MRGEYEGERGRGECTATLVLFQKPPWRTWLDGLHWSTQFLDMSETRSGLLDWAESCCFFSGSRGCVNIYNTQVNPSGLAVSSDNVLSHDHHRRKTYIFTYTSGTGWQLTSPVRCYLKHCVNEKSGLHEHGEFRLENADVVFSHLTICKIQTLWYCEATLSLKLLKSVSHVSQMQWEFRRNVITPSPCVCIHWFTVPRLPNYSLQ